jgi:hypothetical protein
MDTKFFEEYQKQLIEWQRKFFDTWLESLPKATMEVNVTDTFETTLKLQEENVKAFLETQEKTTQMMLEAQKQFWQSYFDLLHKEPVAAGN